MPFSTVDTVLMVPKQQRQNYWYLRKAMTVLVCQLPHIGSKNMPVSLKIVLDKAANFIYQVTTREDYFNILYDKMVSTHKALPQPKTKNNDYFVKSMCVIRICSELNWLLTSRSIPFLPFFKTILCLTYLWLSRLGSLDIYSKMNKTILENNWWYLQRIIKFNFSSGSKNFGKFLFVTVSLTTSLNLKDFSDEIVVTLIRFLKIQ